MSDTETRDFSFGAKAKRTLAKLRPRSSSDERDGNENLGEEFEKAKRWAKLDSLRRKDEEEFLGDRAKIRDEPAPIEPKVVFPPGYPEGEQKEFNKLMGFEKEQDQDNKYLSAHTHASQHMEDFDFNEEIFPDRSQKVFDHKQLYTLTHISDTATSSKSNNSSRPSRPKKKTESLIDFEDEPELSVMAHANAVSKRKLPGGIARRMLYHDKSDTDNSDVEDLSYEDNLERGMGGLKVDDDSNNVELRHILEDNREIFGNIARNQSNREPITDRKLRKMLESPLGRLFFETWTKASFNQRGDNLEGPSGEDLVEVARDYHKGKVNQKSAEKAEILKQIGLYHNACKTEEINKYYAYHSKIGGVKPPKIFSKEDTLHRPLQLKNCNATFPITRPFSDDGKGPDICTFLRQMTKSQNRVCLTRQEFLETLLECCRKPALDRIGPLVSMDYPIETLYSILVSTYDRQISPNDASDLLAKYKAHKLKTIHEVNSDLTMIASRAAQDYSSAAISREFFDEETTKALIRCLPENASRKAKALKAEMRLKMLRNPTFNEFSCAVANLEEDINTEIRKNGVDTKEMYKISLYKTQTKSEQVAGPKITRENGNKKSSFYKKKYTANVNQISGEESGQKTSKPQSKVNEVKSEGKSYHVKIGNSDKLHCILCDQHSHNASDGCKCMFSNSGIQIDANPTTSACSNCNTKLGKTLHHAQSHCPIRDKALELYESGKVYPRGVFRQYCVDNKIGDIKPFTPRNKKDFGNGKNSGYSSHKQVKKQGTVNMISVSNLIAQLPLPKDDFHVFTVDTESRDNFGAKLYLNISGTCANQTKTKQMTCLIDTGSDSCLISKSYLMKTFGIAPNQLDRYLQESDLNLLSYTNDSIEVSGKINLDIHIPYTDRKATLCFYVVNDSGQPSGKVTSSLIGLRAIVDLSLILDSKVNGRMGQIPILYSKYDKTNTVLSSYLTSKGLSECYTHIKCLEAKESRACYFYLNHFFDFGEKDHVLISDDFIKPGCNPTSIQILLTRSQLTFDKGEGKLRGLGYVVNHGESEFRNLKLWGYLENAGNYEIDEIDKETAYKQTKNKKVIMPYPDFYIHGDTRTFLSHSKKKGKRGKVNEVKGNDFPEIFNPSMKGGKNLGSITCSPISLISPKVYKVNKIDKYFPEDDYKVRAVPNSVNNGQGDKNISLSDERMPVVDTHPPDESKIALFNDPTKACQLGQTTFDDKEDFMLTHVGAGRGYTLPTPTDKDDETLKRELLKLDQYEPLIRTHVEDLFIKKYSSIIATSSLSRGDMSRTLGSYAITLKEGVELPRHKKVYFVAPMEQKQLQAILEFLLKNGTIIKADVKGDSVNEFSSPGYLIPKNKPDSAPRLVINFQDINQVIAAEPAILPSADSIIHNLRGAYFYSVNDISNAFHSVSITEASRALTAFSLPIGGGTYQHTCLPTGMKTSPEALNRIMHKAIHYKPDLGPNGEEQWNSDGTLKMVYDPILKCQFLYDDILCWSEAKETYAQSVEAHFKVLEKVISRLAYHKCVIGVHKSQLCKTYINFFGFYISNNYCIADPARVKKLIDAPEPTTRTEARAFLGLINSLRTHLGFTTLKYTGSLQRLTSSTRTKDKFTLDSEQKKDFKAIKLELIKAPIFSRIIDMTAAKIVFSDMAGASEGACYGATLCQVVYPKEGQCTVPPYIDLEDPCHRIIYDNKIMARPLPHKKEGDDFKQYLKHTDYVPPLFFEELKQKYLGYTEAEAANSLAISLQLLLEVMNCGVTFDNILKGLSTAIRTGIERASFMDFIFHHDKGAFQSYIKQLEKGNLFIDKKLFIFKILSEVMFRPITIISSVPEFPSIKEFNGSAYRPPIYFCLYKVNDIYIVKPAVADRMQALQLANFRGCLEVVSYVAKPISEAHKNLHIMDLELQGILHSLATFRKLIGQSPCLLVTDSQCLFQLFSSLNLKTNKKLNRWNFALLELVPQLKIKHCTSADMMSDFLTRQHHLPVGPKDLSLIKLRTFNKNQYDDLIPDIAFSLEEWRDFVEENQNLIFSIKNSDSKVKVSHVKAIKQSVKAVASVLTPAAILKRKISTVKIIEEQRVEFKELFEACSSAPDYTLNKNKKVYVLYNGVICILEDNKHITLCPTNLLPIFISYAHLVTAHGGSSRIKLNLSLISHPDKNKLIEKFCRACYNCQMTNSNTHLNEIGTYPTAQRAMECVSVDYIENLPSNKYKFKHACILTCYLTGAIIAVPTRTLESHEFLRIFLFNVYQTFSPRQILCDGAKAFLSTENLVVLASLGVRVLESSAHNARGHGNVERINGILKSAVMKIYGAKDDNSWVYALPAIVRQLNSTRAPKTGYAPIDLLFGLGVSDTVKHFDMLPKEEVHYKAQNHFDKIIESHDTTKEVLVEVNDKVQNDRVKRVTKINKYRTKKDIKTDDFVFVKNFSGAKSKSTAFRQIFYPTPYRVVTVAPVTAVVQRLNDHFDTKLHFDHLKPYKQMDPAFDFLPPEVKSIVSKDFSQLSDKEIALLCENSAFEIPTNAITLEDHDPHLLSTAAILEQNEKSPDTEIDLDIIEESDSDSEEQENDHVRKIARKRTQNVRFDPSTYLLY